MATTMLPTVWAPSSEEVRRIVVELCPVIDECVRRSRRLLFDRSGSGSGSGDIDAADGATVGA